MSSSVRPDSSPYVQTFHTVVDIAVNDVAVPMIDELLDRMDNVRNMVGDAG